MGIPICPGIYAPGFRSTLRDRIEALESALIEAAETTDDPITSRKLFATLNRSIGGSNALVSGPVQSGGQAGSGTNRSHGDDNG